MTSPISGAQRYTRVAIAIVVAGVVVAAAIATSSFPRTETTTVTSTSTKTTLQTVTVTSVYSCTDNSTIHCVVFQQLGACSPQFWGVPWSVTIGNATEVQPPGTKLPLDNYILYGTMNKNLTVIVFSLPNGLYDFSVSPSAGFFTPTTGSVRVNGTDVLVGITYTGTSCTATSTASASTTAVNGSSYYARDITSDISVGNPGYSYFLNGSVTFMGVKFATICPPIYAGCPISPGTTVTSQETVGAGAIRLNLTFPGGTNETIGGVIGDTTHFFVFSHHANPQAGILIVYTGSGYKSYLLVS